MELTDYPLSELASPARRELVAKVRTELRAEGCSVLPGFIRPELTETLRRQGEQVAPLAYYRAETVNAYNVATDRPLPDGHPGRTTMRRGNAFVARDQLPADFLISRLYTSAVFQRFVADCFGLPEIFELADPLAALCLNVVTPGMAHPWHFDKNEFTVSMLTKAPEAGGIFQYCPNIRTAGAENLGAVREVLDGGGAHRIRGLALRPGDLQLFQGRFSLHRVTEVRGDTARHSAIFAYSERPGVIGGAARTEQLFGRVLPEHRAADRAARADQLLD